jgi:polysaccharide biosynthesis transport protein
MNRESQERALTMVGGALANAGAGSEGARYVTVAAANPLFEPEPEEASVPISHYLWVLRRHKWRMLAFIAGVTLAVMGISARITPVFEATATIDIDRQTPAGVIGQDAVRNAVNDSDQFLATQTRLIQSDSVLRPVSEKYRLLDQEREGSRSLFAFLSGPAGPATASQKEAPVLLKNLSVSRPSNTYLLQIHYRSTDPKLAAQVSNAVAESFLEHNYRLRVRASSNMSAYMEQQLDELRSKMERSAQALAGFERELNVVNPEEKTNILGARLLQLNTEYTNAQAARVKHQAARGSVRTGTIEAAQASEQGEALSKISERLSEALEKFAEVRARFGANHPEYRRAAAQVEEMQRNLDRTRSSVVGRVDAEYDQSVEREAMLRHEVQLTKTELDRMNSRSYEYESLKGEADGDRKLYEELLRKIREAGINASFQNSNVRLADPARAPVVPVSPNIKLNLLLAMLGSTLLAFAAVIISDAVDNTVRDPEQVVRGLGTEVIGTLPAVKNWRGRLGHMAGSTPVGALVRGDADDILATGFEEAIRTLRNSILLADVDRRTRSILVTSATPSEGKSTTAAHLALMHAEQGHRTLLIDGDLRRPTVHKRFELTATKGLSNVLTGQSPWRELVVNPAGTDSLFILPAGPPSRRASELVGRGLEEVLQEAAEEFDMVILDAPPMLGFAEPLQMAAVVDGVVVVTRAGQTPRSALQSVLSTLRRLRANVLGVVLNDMNQGTSSGYHYYSQYGKYYASPEQN